MASTTASRDTITTTGTRTGMTITMATAMTAAMATTITTTEAAAEGAMLYRLLAWLSPAYPVGAYTYSHGLETAVEDGAVKDRAGLVAYVRAALGRSTAGAPLNTPRG